MVGTAMHARSPIVRLLSLTASLALLLLLWAALAPPRFGGQTSFVIVNGNSMEPLYHRGDLVVVRAASQYAIDEIVTYRHPEIGPVIHRIIGRDGERWVFQGDHNTFIDPYHPLTAELIGRAVLHIPSIGKLLMTVRAPAMFAAVALIAVVLIMVTLPRRSPRRARQLASTAMPPASAALLLPALLAVAALACGLWAYTRPAQREQRDELTYTLSGAFTYAAPAPKGIYDRAGATTGEPIFWELSDTLDVAFDYQFTGDATASVKTNGQLDAALGSADGWQRSFHLSPRQELSAENSLLRGQIDLREIRVMIADLEQRAGLPHREYLLTILPQIHTEGTLGGQAVAEDFAPKLTFRSDAFQLQLVRESEKNTLLPVKGGSINRTTQVEEQLLPGTPLTAANGRIAAPVVLALAILLGFALARPLLATLRADEAARIQFKHGALLAEVAPEQELLYTPTVEVANIDTLARLAERHNTLILHRLGTYAVPVGETLYTYTLPRHRAALVSAPSTTPVTPEQTVAWQKAFLGEMQVRGMASQACKAAGIGIVAAYRERECNPAFAQAWDAARRKAIQ